MLRRFIQGLFKPRVDPAFVDRISKFGYEVTKDGAVQCSTCGSYCGQCGKDHSAPSVEAFLEREASDIAQKTH